MHASLSLSSCILDRFDEGDDDEEGERRSCPSGPISSSSGSGDESENNGDMHTSTSRLRVGSYPYVLGTSLLY